MKYQKELGIFLITIGLILIASSSIGITGVAVSEGFIEWTGSIIGLAFFIGGCVVLILHLEETIQESEDEERPNKLYIYVTPESLQKGMTLRGWDPNDLCITAFDPSQKDPELVRKLFGFDKNRVLIEVAKKYMKYFKPRKTGPEKRFQGIYFSKRFLPSSAMIPLDEKGLEIKLKEIVSIGETKDIKKLYNLAEELGLEIKEDNNYRRVLKANKEIIKIPLNKETFEKGEYESLIRTIYKNII